MKNYRFVNIFGIMLLTMIFTLAMAVSVMADESGDPAEGSDNTNVEVAEQEAPAPAPAPVAETPAPAPAAPVAEAPAVEEPAAPQEEVSVSGNTDNDNNDDVDEEFSGEILPEENDEEEGEVGLATWAEPVEGGMLIYVENADGTIDVNFEPNDDDEIKPEVGPAEWDIPVEGGTEHYVEYPNGNVHYWFEPAEEAEGIVSDNPVYLEPYEESSESTATKTSAVYFSDTFVPFAAEETVPTPVIEEVKTSDITPAVDAESAEVLGDYEAAASGKNAPLTAGLAFFFSSVVGVGVLWKLGLIIF